LIENPPNILERAFMEKKGSKKKNKIVFFSI